MGKNNRYHDDEATKIALRHDEIKRQNELKKIQKEKERIEKYVKPQQDKKSSNTLQMDIHRLFQVKEHHRNQKWNDDWFEVRRQCLKLKIWDSFVTKYHLARNGFYV